MNLAWDVELSEVEALAAEAERAHWAMAVSGDATSMAIVQNARSAGLLVRLLHRVQHPHDGDRRILQTKVDRLRALIGGSRC